MVAPFWQLPQWQGHWANYLMLQPPPNLVAFNNNHCFLIPHPPEFWELTGVPCLAAVTHSLTRLAAGAVHWGGYTSSPWGGLGFLTT